MNKIYPTLFSRDSKGKIRTWKMEQNGNQFRTISGLEDGEKITNSWTTVESKNIGKANETSPVEQAEKEVLAKYKDQKSTGYFESKSEIDNLAYFSPQLAKNYEDRKDTIDWTQGVFVSGKLDGLRCIIHSEGMFSRNGKPIISAPHIFNSVKKIFGDFPNLILDSELYCDRLCNNFNKILSLGKKTKPTQEDLIESEKWLQAWVFDIPSIDLQFSSRIEKLQEVLKLIDSPYLRYVNHKWVKSHEDVERALNDYLLQGLEGVMVNLPDAKYENKRSSGLIKYKKFQDCEAEITDIIEGIGNRSTMMGYVKLRLDNGKEFDANARGNEESYRDILRNKKDYIGRKATVRFQNLTPDGIPRFPVVTEFNRSDI